LGEKALVKLALRRERGERTALLRVRFGRGRARLQPLERFDPAVDESAEISGGH